jgi:hypothetical protein
MGALSSRRTRVAALSIAVAVGLLVPVGQASANPGILCNYCCKGSCGGGGGGALQVPIRVEAFNGSG